MLAKTEPWRLKYLEAADYIERHGWCQDAYSTSDGRVCILGALKRVGVYSDEMGDEMVMVLFRFLGQPINRWNDAPGRTKQEAVSALRDCALGTY